MPRLHRFAAALLLGLSLLMGQQAALLHGLGHAADAVKQDAGTAPATCADHALYVAFAGGLTAEPPAAPFVAAVVPAPAEQALRSATLAPRHAFHSRAPPASPA